mmetsp:Transcript_20742/g.51449  ORF Transcript_20742/g.51449 Transcript_20742/m.51449 type:complete len:594 (+) Transcript_20742:64-1845(+)
MTRMFRNIRNAFNNATETRPRRQGESRSVPSAAGTRRQRPPQQQRQRPQHQQQQTPQAPPQRAPPASMKAIKKLPTIRVAPEDLIDPNNRECCICLEENNLDDLVTRLPCAHIFHTHCIIDWLSNHSCTCPVCRYELPTDYPQYEEGRIERMKLRKPRFAMHELKRMTVSDLKELYKRPLSGALERKDLIQALIDNDWIDIIPSPEPVQYELEVLKNMKISQLKRTMAEAGVFFRKEDVLMKSDMITVFENSGRLVLIRSEQEEDTDPLCNYETIANPTTDKGWVDVEMDSESNDAVLEMDSENDDAVLVETINEDSECPDESVETNSTIEEEIMNEEVVEMFPRRNEDNATRVTPTMPNTESLSATDYEAGNSSVDQSSAESDTQNSTHTEIHLQQQTTTENVNDSVTGSTSQPEAQGSRQMEVDEVDVSAIMDLTRSGIDLRSTFDHYTINNLQTLGRDLHIDLSYCLEREEMIETFVNMGITGTEDPLVLSPLMFSTWSVSQLRVVASEMKVSLSECTNKDEMVNSILHAGNIERPYLREYLRSLSPLTTKSLADLRAIARELQINIQDCLEKDEIIQRLIARDRRVTVN